jgi:hypothetical protein
VQNGKTTLSELFVCFGQLCCVSCSLFHINHIGNGIGDKGAVAMGRALKRNTTLLELRLNRISFDYLFLLHNFFKSMKEFRVI